MLRRIQLIVGVGSYASCQPAQIQFEKLSLIYGENCYGKSTLCDILRSLAENSPSYIIDRATLPPVAGRNQHIQLNVVLPGQTNESTLSYRQGAWNPRLPNPLRFQIFDTEFIHRNLFTGLTVERQNHENITRFVLGDAGVRIANRIAEINSETRTLNKALRDSEAGPFQGVQDIPAFVNMPPPDRIEEIDQRITDHQATLEQDRALERNLASARTRPEPTQFPVLPGLESVIHDLAANLSATHEQAHREAEALLELHIRNHVTDPDRGRAWIRDGIALIHDEVCPFCGQHIVDNASALIATYRTVFNDAFERYCRETISALEQCKQTLQLCSLSELPLRLDNNRNALLQYPELSSRPSLQTLFRSIDATATDIIALHQEWTVEHQRYSHDVAATIQRKREAVHSAIPIIDATALLDHWQRLATRISDYNSNIHRALSEIGTFKASLDSAQVSRRIQGTAQVLSALHLQKKRHDLDAVCRAYSELRARLQTLEAESAQRQQELDTEQSAFLGRYFAAINRIFSSLGSSRFTISSETSRRGNMPTIQLRVAYNDTPITPERLRTCFSESDRRALALAIFWSRLELQEPNDLANTIVVLDDPVTSFDDGRIDRTIRLIETQIPQVRQIIVLSHYTSYLKTFFTRLRGQQNESMLASLFQDTQGTQIRRTDTLDFIETDHERAYRRIATYISRNHEQDIFQDLRVFLETEVRMRYHRAIIQNNWRNEQFRNLLDELTGVTAMTEETRRLIEPLRLTLNTDHHVWMSRTREEKIGIATDVFQFIYEIL